MIWLIIILIILMFLLLLIIFTKLTIQVNYFHHNDNDDLKVELRAWFGLIKYKINIPLIKIDDDSPSIVLKGHTKMGSAADNSSEQKTSQITPNKIKNYLYNAKELIKHVVEMKLIIKRFLSKVSIKKVEWHSLVGIGDAAYTGMLAGSIWAIKGSIIGILSHSFSVKEIPDVSVTPHFQASIIQTRLICIFQFRIGHAILAGLKIIKFWKGGRPKFKTNPSISKEKTKSV